jgi:CubicO group peptidase (beta-lactamase class C family)
MCLRIACCVLLFGFIAPSAAGQAADEPVWMVQPPEAHGFVRAALDRAFDHAESLAPLNSLLIARRETIVAEDYYRGMQPNEDTNIKSASKTVLSALVGIALEEGHLDSLDQPIAPFFPEHLGEDADPRKRQITLRNLLTMQAGLESTSFGNYGAWVTSDDWVRDALNRPIERPPGTDMMYSTGTSHLVSAILTKATGMSTKAYAQSRLFGPLGIAPPSWQQDPQGIYFGGNNLALSPRDLLKFGQLYTNEGRYNGRQIVPADWVRASMQRYVLDTYRGFSYGYFWWIEAFAGVRTHFAWGYGGQYVFVIPGLDLVVVCTSDLNNRPSGIGDHNERIYTLLAEYVLPAVTS